MSNKKPDQPESTGEGPSAAHGADAEQEFRQVHPFPQLPEKFFREEALEHYRERPARSGQVLRLTPGWTTWFYWVLAASLIAGLAFLTFGQINEWAEGPAIVRVEGQLPLTARQAGVVNFIGVRPGQDVSEGEVLVRFYDAQEAAEVEFTRREYEFQLLAWLREPTDPSTRQALAGLRARQSHAEARLAERTLRASSSGRISDIRVRPGQSVLAGEVVLTLRRSPSSVSIVALLPGHYRPMLRLGMPLRLEVSGYPHAYQELTIDGIDDEIVGPAAVRRYLGADVADTVAPQGPLVLVRARLPEETFEAAGRLWPLHDGMHGLAQARVRRESILFTFIPGLRAIVDRHAG